MWKCSEHAWNMNARMVLLAGKKKDVEISRETSQITSHMAQNLQMHFQLNPGGEATHPKNMRRSDWIICPSTGKKLYFKPPPIETGWASISI